MIKLRLLARSPEGRAIPLVLASTALRLHKGFTKSTAYVCGVLRLSSGFVLNLDYCLITVLTVGGLVDWWLKEASTTLIPQQGVGEADRGKGGSRRRGRNGVHLHLWIALLELNGVGRSVCRFGFYGSCSPALLCGWWKGKLGSEDGVRDLYDPLSRWRQLHIWRRGIVASHGHEQV